MPKLALSPVNEPNSPILIVSWENAEPATARMTPKTRRNRRFIMSAGLLAIGEKTARAFTGCAPVQRSAFNVRRSTFNVRCSALNVRRSAFSPRLGAKLSHYSRRELQSLCGKQYANRLRLALRRTLNAE